MTANQSAILVKNPHTKKAMAVLTKFAELESTYKAMEKEAKAANELIKEAMIAGGVDRVEIDMPGWEGYITLAERTNYKAENIEDVSEDFLKLALDTDKVKAQEVLTGNMPDGIEKSTTRYITKKFKAVK